MTVVRIRPPRLAVLEWETNLGVLRARLARRSWWTVRYTDGRVVHEWERDWSHLPYHGRQAVRLYCPDGKFVELGTEHGDSTGKLFQLKVAVATLGGQRGTLGQLVGMLHGTSGEAICYAWERDEHGGGHLVGPFDDNVYHLNWHGPWHALNADVLGLDDGEGR